MRNCVFQAVIFGLGCGRKHNFSPVVSEDVMLVEHKLELFSSFDVRAYHEYGTRFSSLFESNWEGERETNSDPNDLKREVKACCWGCVGRE